MKVKKSIVILLLLVFVIPINFALNTPNDAPVIEYFQPESATFDLDESATVEFSYLVFDPNGDNLTVSWLFDSIEQTTTQAWQYSPDFDAAGDHNVTLLVFDGIDTAAQEWTVTVYNVDQPPVWDFIPVDQIIEEDTVFSYDVNASDPHDPDSYITYSVYSWDEEFWLSELNEWSGVEIDENGLITWTPPENWFGVKEIEVTASDDEWYSITALLTVTVMNVNDAPVLEEIDPIEVVESSLITIFPTAYDADDDPLTFNYSAPLNSAGEWQTVFGDDGTYEVMITVSDGNGGTASQNVTLTVLNDLDEDGDSDQFDPDDDNDGVDDIEDHLSGDVEDVETNIPALNLSIGNLTDLLPTFSGIQEVIVSTGDGVLLSFDFDFSNTLTLAELVLLKNENSTVGSLVINGLTLPEGETKTVYVDKLLSDSSVCILDAEISSITEMSSDCNQAHEIKLSCPETSGNYSCIIENGKFKISGLRHSGIKEIEMYSAPPPAPSSDGNNNGGKRSGGGRGSSKSTNAIVPAKETPRVPNSVPQPAIETPTTIEPKTETASTDTLAQPENIVEESSSRFSGITGAVVGLTGTAKERPLAAGVLLLSITFLGVLAYRGFCKKKV